MSGRMEGSFLFLGTGASTGIPVIGCECTVCHSLDPRNRRTRASIFIEFEGRHLLIDAGPDVREQLLTHRIQRVDGLLLTHTHYDHIAGLEELRVFNFRQQHAIPCLLSSESLVEVRQRFYYLFLDQVPEKNVTAQFDFRPLEALSGKTVFCDLPLAYMSYQQGHMHVLGFRFGDLAYITDIKSYPSSIFNALRNLKTLVVSALRFTPAPLQFTVDEAIDFARKIAPEQTYLMHVSHDIEHAHLERLLPPSIYLAYDGLRLSFSVAPGGAL